MSSKPILQYLLPTTSEVFQKSDFEFQRKIGSGAFGQVWRVRHKRTLVQYAIKQIQKIKILRLLDQFKRELSIMYSISHPYIVKLFSHFEDEKYIYMLLELAEGGTLFYKLSQENVLLERVAAQYFREVVSAIEYLHSLDPAIIHRDVKPENILIQKTGAVKLSDFGWANYVTQPGERTTACGTLEYLPPEMIDEKGHDTCADIWCLGILLYEMLAGITPFKASGRDKILANIKKSSLKFPRGFPVMAKDLIVRMLEKDKAKRFNILQVKSHKWLLSTAPLREFIQPLVAKPVLDNVYHNNETENSCSENELEEEIKSPPENTFRKSILMLKNNLEKKSLVVISQKNSLKATFGEISSSLARVQELEEKIKAKNQELGLINSQNKEYLARIFDLNLDLEKVQDLGSFYNGGDMGNMIERHLHLKKLINLRKVILENLKSDVIAATKEWNEGDLTLKLLHCQLQDLKNSSCENRSTQKSSVYELQMNLQILKAQLEEKTRKSSGFSMDQSEYKELATFIRDKLQSFPNMHRELNRKLDETEDLANEKEQQISELIIEFEMKKSQKLYNLRKKKDEITRHHRKIREDQKQKSHQILDQNLQSLRDQLLKSRKVQPLDNLDIEKSRKRLIVSFI